MIFHRLEIAAHGRVRCSGCSLRSWAAACGVGRPSVPWLAERRSGFAGPGRPGRAAVVRRGPCEVAFGRSGSPRRLVARTAGPGRCRGGGGRPLLPGCTPDARGPSAAPKEYGRLMGDFVHSPHAQSPARRRECRPSAYGEAARHAHRCREAPVARQRPAEDDRTVTTGARVVTPPGLPLPGRAPLGPRANAGAACVRKPAERHARPAEPTGRPTGTGRASRWAGPRVGARAADGRPGLARPAAAVAPRAG